MSQTRRTLLATTAAAISLSGCLGGGEPGAEGETETTTTTATETTTETQTTTATETTTETQTTTEDTTTEGGSSAPTVRIREHSDHGEILAGSEGSTLYMFDPDTQGAGESACQDGCAEAWPPLTLEDGETASTGENVAADLSTFEREDGTRQVAANGWPLYYFANDEEPGDATGQGVNDVWWVLEPDGTPIRAGETDDDGDNTGGEGNDDTGGNGGDDGDGGDGDDGYGGNDDGGDY